MIVYFVSEKVNIQRWVTIQVIRSVLQWLIGQGHIPVLPEENRNVKVQYGVQFAIQQLLHALKQ